MEQAMRDGVREQFHLIREWTLMICVLGSGPWGGRCLVALCFGVPTKRSWCLCVSENHPPVVPVWASGAWKHSCLSGLADRCWIILECVGSSLENCFVWFVLSKELLLNIGMGLWWHPWIFVGFHLGSFFEAGQCCGERSAFSAPVRGVVHQPYQSSNFIVVALGEGYWLIHVPREGWSGCLWVVSDFGICCLLLKYTEPTGPQIRN